MMQRLVNRLFCRNNNEGRCSRAACATAVTQPCGPGEDEDPTSDFDPVVQVLASSAVEVDDDVEVDNNVSKEDPETPTPAKAGVAGDSHSATSSTTAADADHQRGTPAPDISGRSPRANNNTSNPPQGEETEKQILFTALAASGSSSFDHLPANQRQRFREELQRILQNFVTELEQGKAYMKLGRNSRCFYRWCGLDLRKRSFNMHVKGQICEYPFRCVRAGYDTTDFYYDVTKASLPSEELGAVLILTDNRRLNLVFSDVAERDEFVVCINMLVGDRDGCFAGLGGSGGESSEAGGGVL